MPGHLVLGGRGLGMPRAGLLAGIAEAPEVVPAALVMGRPSGSALHPGGNFVPSPDAAFGGRCLKRPGQGVLLVWGKERTLAGMLHTAVGEAGDARLVVALQEDPDPFGTQADEGGGCVRGLALGDEPQGLVAAGCRGGRGLLVVLPEFLNREVGSKL